MVLRHALRVAADLILYGRRSGLLWLPLLVVVLAIASLVVLAVKAVVPAVTYVLF